MKAALIVFDKMTYLDFVGFYDPLTRLRSMNVMPDFEWRILSNRAQVADDRGPAGMRMLPDAVLEPLGEYDLLYIPGGMGTRPLQHDREFVDWLKTAAPAALKVSVCTGALLLGAAGFLKGRRATTHPGALKDLEPYCDKVMTDRIVDEGGVITGGGVSSSIDLGLHVVQKLRWSGGALADRGADVLSVSMELTHMQPLAGIRVLDFSTLLPGPLATLLLAEAGAEVIKIERPGTGDEMRTYMPKFGADSVNFAMLNRKKRSIAIDLKSPGAVERLMPLVAGADVIVEQFRPGVMDRLGLGYDAVSRANPRIIYCAITGYGQSGARASTAAHDLNYAADTGMLALAAGADGAPVPPAALVADIGGGSYPAVVNILLALRERDRTGRGCKLDVAMADNLFAFMYWAMGDGLAAGAWPAPGKALVTGGSPRYNVYRTRDGRFIAAAPLEEKFWQTFCDVIGLPAVERNDARDPEVAIRAVAARISEKTADEWRTAFAGKDLCCNVVSSIQDALADPHFRGRGLFEGKLAADGGTITALPLPVAAQFRSGEPAGYPALGEANSMLEKKP